MRTKPGSPPRGRGKVDIDLFGFLCRGITPAWAGKRSWKHDHVRKHGDHPRVGGEKSFIYQFPFFRRGSPPRGRGKDPICMSMFCLFGITPAWAGKRSSYVSVINHTWDHPRVGGEKLDDLQAMFQRLGSPPRGRGKGRKYGHANIQCRITPAWAGKRRHQTVKEKKHEDHPRVGGEKLTGRQNPPFTAGSPPRGRGKVPDVPVAEILKRITPAWAGKRHRNPK